MDKSISIITFDVAHGNCHYIITPSNRRVMIDLGRSDDLGYISVRDAFGDEVMRLTALRDALLPKLIRGEIRVKDAERFLEERRL